MNISTRQLQAFLHLARLKSFTRAAERLHITQAGLSAMIRDIESQLGCRLFDRTTRVVTLTEAGERLVPSAERMLAEFSDACLNLGMATARARRILSVAVAPVVAASFLPEVCEHFAALRPDASVRLRDVTKDRIPGMVERGEVDVGFSAYMTPLAGIECVELFKCQLLCVARPGVLRMTGGGADGLPDTRWDALPALPVLASVASDETQVLIDAHLAAIGRGDEDRPSYESMHTIIAMAGAGFGIGIVPSFALHTCQRLGVEVARLCDPVVELGFYRISRKGRELPEVVAPFVASLVAVAQRMGVAAVGWA